MYDHQLKLLPFYICFSASTMLIRGIFLDTTLLTTKDNASVPAALKLHDAVLINTGTSMDSGIVDNR